MWVWIHRFQCLNDEAQQHLMRNKAPGQDSFQHNFSKNFGLHRLLLFSEWSLKFRTIRLYLQTSLVYYLNPAKILCSHSARKKSLHSQYILTKQFFFIKGRHSANNTSRLINIIDYCSINKLEATDVSLDTKKKEEAGNHDSTRIMTVLLNISLEQYIYMSVHG